MEKRIEQLFRECKVEQESLKIPYSDKITEVKINHRAKSRFGSCRAVRSPVKQVSFVIELSDELMRCSDKEVKTVIHHEILHTCKECMNHGARWKYYADKLNAEYGYNIKRAASYESMGLETPEKREKVKYTVVCEKCGLEIKRYRKCRLVDEIENYRCGKCGGKLKLK